MYFLQIIFANYQFVFFNYAGQLMANFQDYISSTVQDKLHLVRKNKKSSCQALYVPVVKSG
jgi:hypothetical protein